ncbi:Chromo domain-like protein [Beauveria brongniartii RCEF 3172]|uniref:Chromo domain-like protein n=1 Tax=Beauveria brongniartii RCEF 3172 TaxID=1081107 RepID=A0A166ZAW1_9HYPO|nr:Chromo domain-like protein [Beauveria brongniartii RCEF 3172]
MPRSKKPARTGKKPAEQTFQTGWYTIRQILDEKRVANRIQYLVDWDDDAKTGESHEPTWVSSSNVTPLAKSEWKNKKSTSASKPPPATSVSQTGQTSQSDQSPRPANFRQLERTKSKSRARSSSTASSIDAGPARKRPRYSPSSSTEPVPSIVSAPSPSPAADVPEFEGPADVQTELIVDIPNAPNFDPAEFFSVRGSQSTNYPSQSLSELEEQDQRLALSSQISLRTVPDSQDYSGQSLSTASLHKVIDSAVSSLPESDCAVIPDSLQRQGNRVVPAYTENTHECIPESSIPAETNADSAIPSRQQDAKEQSFSGVPRFNSTSDSSNQPAKSPQITARGSLPASLGEAPEFLTQLEILEHSTLLTSSPHREQPSAPLSQAAPSPAPQASHQASHDAQVVPNFFDTVLERAIDIKETNTTPAQGPVRDPQYKYSHISDEIDLEEISMADSTGTQRSAVDELNDLFTINPTTDSQAQSHDTNQPAATEDGASELFKLQNQPSQNPSASVDSLDPSHWHPPTVEAVDESDLTASTSGIAFNTQPDTHAQLLIPVHSHEGLPGTVSPSEILASAGAVLDDNASPILEPPGVIPAAVFGSSAERIIAGQQSPGSPSSSATSDDPVLMHHLVTLPFQASLRPQYDDILLAHRKHVKEFSEVFSNEEYVEPNPSLVEKIDELFSALRNICDYPQDLIGTSLEKLSPNDQVKYACDANPKFSFVFELLQGIETNIRVLIVAQSVELLRLLAHVAATLDIDCSARALESLHNVSNDSACNVTLALPNEEFDIDEFEVVIGFDHSFGSSPVAQALLREGQAVRPPMVITLVTTHSIEHIDRQLQGELNPLERRNALLASIVNARKLTSDPDRGYPEPYSIATMFYEFLNGAAEEVFWDPIPLPEDVLDIYMSSQSQSQQPAVAETESSRKRKLDDDNEEEAKRMRSTFKESSANKEELPLPDDVRWLLDSVSAAGQALPGSRVSIRVPLSVLQAIAEKMSEIERRAAASDKEAQYKSVIESLEARLKEYERTSSKTYQAYRAAVEERTKFEKEKTKADAALQSAQEAAEKESTKLQTKIGELEVTVSRLTSDSASEGANPLAASERLLTETQDTVKRLEKRLENATQDGEYAKNAYQEASSAATVLQTENKELKAQNEKLLQRSSENVTKIHEIQSESMAKVYLQQIAELRTQMRERETELDRIREELRQARTRRETRQASVPRSPRMGLMSPRVGWPYANPASRGTSPTGTTEGAAMIGALPAGNGNGRWNHLRE